MVTVGERIVKLETKIDTVQEDITEIKELIKCMPKQFADKWVEKALYGTFATVGVFIIGFVLSKVLGA